MESPEAVNRLRTLYYLAGILHNQQHDPLCSGCIAFSRSVEAVRERVGEAEAVIAAAPVEFSAAASRIHEMLGGITVAGNPVGQKRAGCCMMPQGVCFPKYAMAFLEKAGD